jgi:hypothetical protein
LEQEVAGHDVRRLEVGLQFGGKLIWNNFTFNLILI